MAFLIPINEPMLACLLVWVVIPFRASTRIIIRSELDAPVIMLRVYCSWPGASAMMNFLLGVEKYFPEQLSVLAYRKKRNWELSQEEKEYNQGHSKKRIVIEHTICKLKKYRIMSDVFRNKLRKFSKVSDIVSGLVNYRIMKQQN